MSKFLLLFAFFIAAPVSAATLSPGDTDLGRITAAKSTDGLIISVDVGYEIPLATHIIARFQNNQPLMRGRDGLWAPWDGDPAKLDDVGVTPAAGKLTFPIFDHLPDGLFYPVSFTVITRNAEGLKSGTLVVDGP